MKCSDAVKSKGTKQDFGVLPPKKKKIETDKCLLIIGSNSAYWEKSRSLVENCSAPPPRYVQSLSSCLQIKFVWSVLLKALAKFQGGVEKMQAWGLQGGVCLF